MSNFVAQRPGEFIFIPKEGDDFSRNIDPSSGHPEGLKLWLIVQKELIPQAGIREMPRNTLPHAFQVPGKLVLVNHLKITFELLADNVTQFHFLLRAEQKFRRIWSDGWQRRTSGLGLNGGHTKKEQSEAKGAHGLFPDTLAQRITPVSSPRNRSLPCSSTRKQAIFLNLWDNTVSTAACLPGEPLADSARAYWAVPRVGCARGGAAREPPYGGGDERICVQPGNG